MAFLVAGLTLMVLAVLALTRIRRRSGEEEEVEAHALGATAVLVVGALVALFSGVANLGPALRVVGEMFPPWLQPLAGGVIFGLLVYVGAVFIFLVCGRVLHWALKESRESDETLGFRMRRHVYGSVATVMVLAVFWVVVTRIGAEAVPWGIALFAAVVHLYDPWVRPWLLYVRSQRLDPDGPMEIRQWLDEQVRRWGIPKFYLRVQAGGMVNALVSGGAYRHFIVLGQGLLDRLSAEHVKAILAHELGHVLNRDNTRIVLPVVALGTILHAMYLKEVALEQQGPVLIIGAVVLGMVIFWYLLPLYFLRRRQFEADRRAVELIGDPELVAQALEAFAEVTETPLNQKSWTHPSMGKRIEVIRRLGAERRSETNSST